MANGDILQKFDKSKYEHFKKDFFQMMKVGAELDRYYGEMHVQMEKAIEKYQNLVEQFNRKYNGIKLNAKPTIDEFKTRIFLKSADIKEFFAESASKIPGIRSVGRSNFGQVDVSNTDVFAKFIDSLSDKLFLSYSDPETGTSTVAAALDKKEKMIELIYNFPDMLNENGSSFKICAYYAMKEDFDIKIEIFSEASTFGFLNLLDEVEKREWHDRFSPRFLE